ncbi:MAG: hypothetical protein ACTSR8_03595 [Promethearchaeota archaeon]
MEKCIICGKLTSFKFEGEGEYKGKIICPSCQAEKAGTKFTGCTQEEKCSIKIKRD